MSARPILRATQHARVTSAYGAQTRAPLVNLVIGDALHTWPAEEARRVGLLLIEVALAAEADAFLFEWGQAQLGDERAGAAVLHEFRAWRQRKEG